MQSFQDKSICFQQYKALFADAKHKRTKSNNIAEKYELNQSNCGKIQPFRRINEPKLFGIIQPVILNTIIIICISQLA